MLHLLFGVLLVAAIFAVSLLGVELLHGNVNAWWFTAGYLVGVVAHQVWKYGWRDWWRIQ